MNDYSRFANSWDSVFKQEVAKDIKHSSGCADFDRALDWLSLGSQVVLDVGCGSGTALLLLHNRETVKNIGIDISTEAIHLAKEKTKTYPKDTFCFIADSTIALKNMESNSVDAILLSNILDNLYPEDAKMLINDSARIVRRNGKILVKLNDYLNACDISTLGIKETAPNVFDDGMLFYNAPTAMWVDLFSKQLTVVKTENILIAPQLQNRLFFLQKP